MVVAMTFYEIFCVYRLFLDNYVHIVYVHECEIRSPYLHTCFFLFLLDYNHKRLATNMLFTWADYKDMAFDFFSVQTNVVLSVTYVVPSKQCHLIFFIFYFLWISDKAQSTYVQRRPSSTQHYQDISCTGVGKLTANFPAFLQLIQRRRWFATINNPDPSKKWKTTKQEFIWGEFKPQFIFLHRGKI